MPKYRDAIIRHVNDPNYRPVKPKVIAKKLGVEGDEAAQVKKEIKKLVRSGQLAYGPSHLVCPVAAEHPAAKVGQQPTKKERGAYVVGTFRRNASGYGFVRPEGVPKSEGRDADIYVPAKSTGDAASGDKVRVKVSDKRGRMGKLAGSIVDIVERSTNNFVGTYFERVGMGVVEVDGAMFANPIYVGDPGAKGAQPDDKVVIEMVRFPSHVRDGEGVITDILGKRGQPGVDTLSIIHEFNLPGDFAEDALAAARRQAEQFDESIPDSRTDLRSETVITIDPATARDFDDAISLEKLDNGHWILGVHIADVSHFVQPKSALDREARDRATSVYLPDRVIPMLPEIISNNLASLQPDHVRYAVTARIEFSDDGLRIGVDVFKSAIKSCRRFTYEEVDDYLANRERWKSKLKPRVHELLARMHSLAMTLRERRFRRGALELSMPELEIELDKQGRVCGAHLEQNTESHQIIEEFMLAANEAVAERLADQQLLFLRRIHGAPDPRKLKALTSFVGELGIKTESLQNRFALQTLLDQVKGDPREHAVNYAVLRSMQRAVYSPEEEGHFALSSDCYCHFTSPIRRYPDLTIHRLYAALAEGKPLEQQLSTLMALGDHCSEREQRAADAERELTKVKLLDYMADKVGMELDGVITGVESFGLFVIGSQLPAEGFVHISGLTDDYYRYDRTGHIVQGMRSGNSFRLGDPVRVAVAAVDVDRRELDFRMLGRRRQPNDSGAGELRGQKSKKSRPQKKKSPRKGGKKRRR